MANTTTQLICSLFIFQEEFEDTKGVIRIRKSKKGDNTNFSETINILL